MPKVVLTYFNFKAVGESIRLLLLYGGQEFEDIRLTSEEWRQYKPTTPFGQAPVLEIDDKKYAQSMAISRYLGRKYGLAGATLEEDLEIDMIVDYINEIRAKGFEVRYEKDEAIQTRKHADFTQNVYPVMLNRLNDIIEKNNGYIALGKLTWADFLFAGMFDYLKMMMRTPDLEEKYPNFKKVVDRVHALPQLQEYLANAPKTTH
ncbi:hypothetical protein ABMA27_005175 [Loxostege sticticalis]|uniref:glutathione transferase n=1 Tax=Loxostege sticticalis TaxID=481309 RepID=A0ABR3HM97_LOXSC